MKSLYAQKTGKKNKNGQDSQMPPGSALGPIYCSTTQNNLSQQLNSEEVEFAKIKPFDNMKIRPGCEELRRDFLCSECSKKDELCAKMCSIVHVGKTPPTSYNFYQVLPRSHLNIRKWQKIRDWKGIENRAK